MIDMFGYLAAATTVIAFIFGLGYNWKRLSVVERRVDEMHETNILMRDKYIPIMEQIATDIRWIKRELNKS